MIRRLALVAGLNSAENRSCWKRGGEQEALAHRRALVLGHSRMGAGASVTDVKGMDSSALSATVKGMGPAYEGYGAAIEENQITGDFIASMSPDEFKETLGELGVTKLHQKILSHSWTACQSTGAAVTAAGGAVGGAAGEAGQAMGNAGSHVAAEAKEVAASIDAPAVDLPDMPDLPKVPIDVGMFDPDALMSCCSGLAKLVDAVPMIGPIGAMIGGIAEAARDAKVNKIAVNSMACRIQELALVLAELIPTALRTGQMTPALEAQLRRLTGLVQRAKQFCEEFGKRGFISKMLKGFWDAEKIKELDRDISATVSDMTVTLSVSQIHMQSRTFEEVTQLSAAVKQSQANGGGNEAAIAAAAGCSVAEATAELSSGLQEIKEMNKKMLEGQDEIKNMLVQVLDDKTRKENDTFVKFQEDLGLSGKEGIPWDDFVTCFEGEFLNGEDLPEDVASQFKKKLDKDGDGSIVKPEWLKFNSRWTKAKNKEGMRDMLEFLRKWLVGDMGPDMIVLEIEVPYGVAPGMVMAVEHEGQSIEVTCPAGANPGNTLRIEVPATKRPDPPPPAQNMGGEMVDLTGDGRANAIGQRDAHGSFTELHPLPGAHISAGAPMGQVHVDLSGDGRANAIGVDTTGDGMVDTLLTPEMQQQRQQMQQQQHMQQMQQQQQQMHQQMHQPVQITVPPGAVPGMQIQIQHPLTGAVVEVQVPPGAMPGTVLTIQI